MESVGTPPVAVNIHPNMKRTSHRRPQDSRLVVDKPLPTPSSTVLSNERARPTNKSQKVDWGRSTLSEAVSPGRTLKPTALPQNRQVKLGKSNKSNLKQSQSGKLNISRQDTVKLSVNIREEVTHNESITLLEPQQSKRDITPAKSCISLKSSARLLPGVSTARLKLDDILTKKSNIKSFGRFRPMSEMEIQLSQSGLGGTNCSFQSAQNVLVTVANGQQLPFTLDRIFAPQESQQQVYEEVGRQIVNDLFSGYNGTLFAYGQTGSGKTHTMFGVLSDSKLCGIIPRAVRDVFHHISIDEEDKKYILTCSILEIYKETLFDLLVSANKENCLKIKESSSKGIYVQGIQEVPVTCQQQLLELIVQANNNKSVRSTKMNEYSSRSHTIVMLEVVQRYPNGLQKKGRLNLVDLAGSEKVSKSGSVGESLQEAKKINLSLSCLGNVIHALTSNNEHIPYRESKLTRLLQESLGGNYKTYLVATCSPHSSNLEETLSTLKFASRVKTIKNSCKINVVNSTASFKLLVGVQKQEIADLTELVKKLYSIYQRLKQQLLSKYRVLPTSVGDLLEEFDSYYHNGFVKNVQGRNRLNEALSNQSLMKSYGIKDSGQLSGFKAECQQALETGVSTSQVSHNSSKAMLLAVETSSRQANQLPMFHKTSTSVEQQSQQKTQTDNYLHKLQLEEKDLIVKELEGELTQLRKKLLRLQNQMTDLQQEKNTLEDRYTSEIGRVQYGRFQTDVLQKQIDSLMGALCRSDSTVGNLLAQKNALLNQKLEDALGRKFDFKEIRLGQLLKNNLHFVNARSTEFKSILESSLVRSVVVEQQTHSMHQGSFAKLKHDLTEAHITNQHLIRTIAAIEWKQFIESGRSKLKSMLADNQEKTITRLEKVIKEATESHRLIRQQIERLELEDCFRQKKSCLKEMPNIKESPRPQERKTKLLAPISKRTTQQFGNGQSPFRDQLNRLNIEEIVPELKGLRETISRLQQDILPVTYEGMSSTLKDRNRLIQSLYDKLLNNEKLRHYLLKGYLSQQQVSTSQSLRKQNQRLANKLLSLQTELQMETAKGQHFRDAYLHAQQQVNKIKSLSDELEKCLQTTLKQQNEKWQQTLQELQQQHKGQLQSMRCSLPSYDSSQRQSEGRPNNRKGPASHFQSHF